MLFDSIELEECELERPLSPYQIRTGEKPRSRPFIGFKVITRQEKLLSQLPEAIENLITDQIDYGIILALIEKGIECSEFYDAVLMLYDPKTDKIRRSYCSIGWGDEDRMISCEEVSTKCAGRTIQKVVYDDRRLAPKCREYLGYTSMDDGDDCPIVIYMNSVWVILYLYNHHNGYYAHDIHVQLYGKIYEDSV